jgi:DNA ligase D-like protein (predicted ligase)
VYTLNPMSAAPTTAGAMKAVLTDARFSDPDWIFERKLDGIRCMAIRDGGPVRLLSRNDLPLNGRFPGVAAALDAQPSARFAVDGEVVAFDGDQTSFQRLGRGGAVFFYVFDMLWLDGRDVRELPLRERKALLRDALTFDDPLRLTEYRNEAGEAMFEEACRKGWEGVIAKRADSVYVDGRSRDWLKFKCEHGQELVIGGFTAPRGSRTDFGALLVGVYDMDGALRYAGKVGTGFDHATLRSLGERLRDLRRDDAPFADAPRFRDATWVEPELVAQVGFAEWTSAGRLRHPRFLGLRIDKTPRSVGRETAQSRNDSG